MSRATSAGTLGSEMSVSNTLLVSAVVGATRVEKWVMPIMMSRNRSKSKVPLQGFCEEIGDHDAGRAVQEVYLAVGNTVFYKKVPDVDVSRTLTS